MLSVSSGLLKTGPLIGLLMVVPLAGCAEPTAPSQPPDAATADVPTAPPVMPPEARQSGETGADAFVAHYYELVHYGQATGDWEPLQALSAPGCRQCEAFWAPDPKRILDPDQTELMPPYTEIENFRASVSVSVMEPREDRTFDVPDLWVDVVQATYQDGHWTVQEIEVRG